MSHPIHSVLHGLLERLNNEQDFAVAQEVSLGYIKESNINDTDKRRIDMIIRYQVSNTIKLYQYLYNSLLKYEGLGTVGKKDNGNVQHLGVKKLRSGMS